MSGDRHQLNVEVFSDEASDYVLVGALVAGSQPGSISATNPDGTREIYVFGVDEDSGMGYVKKAPPGIDSEYGGIRKILSSFDTMVDVASLGYDGWYELEDQTDQGPSKRKMRFKMSTPLP